MRLDRQTVCMDVDLIFMEEITFCWVRDIFPRWWRESKPLKCTKSLPIASRAVMLCQNKSFKFSWSTFTLAKASFSCRKLRGAQCMRPDPLVMKTIQMISVFTITHHDHCLCRLTLTSVWSSCMAQEWWLNIRVFHSENLALMFMPLLNRQTFFLPISSFKHMRNENASYSSPEH